jgi:hypothetical protein
MVGQGFQDGTGAIGALLKEDWNRLFQGGEAVIPGTFVAVDAIQERGEINQLVARLDELQVQEFLFARHAENVRGESPQVNR